jgi:hypothetical protein
MLRKVEFPSSATERFGVETTLSIRFRKAFSSYIGHATICYGSFPYFSSVIVTDRGECL